jgi:RNA recognition motif-containing protein
MNDERRSRGGRRRNRGGRGRGHGRDSDAPRAPAKKKNPILAFVAKLFGAKGRNGQPETTSRRRDDAPRRDRPPPRERVESPAEMPEITTTRLYVGNLSYDATESDLFDLFGDIGEVKGVEIVRDKSERSKGFGFVEMNSVETAKSASEKYNRSEFQGRQIIVAGAKN